MQLAHYALKLNKKALCVWLPIRNLNNISRMTGGIELELLGPLTSLLLILQFK